jgi:DNA-binding beta-propeller fold protein YncE
MRWMTQQPLGSCFGHAGGARAISGVMRAPGVWILPVILAAFFCLATGCQTEPGAVFPEIADAPMWPPPPDVPRIRWIGQLATSADLKPGMNPLETLGQALFGKEESHSMLSPMAVCTDRADRVFVADSNAQLVHVFDLKTRRYAMWKPGKDQPPFNQPVGIAWDEAGRRLLVSDSVAGAIFIFNNDGQYTGQFGTGVLQRPVGLTVDGAQHRVFVADAKAHQVLIFAADGKLQRRLGTRGEALGQFNYPTNVALDPTGLLYVSDSLNFRVQQFDAQLRPIAAFGKQGDMPGYFAQPKGLATDSEGHIYVLDAQFENIQLFDRQGQVLMDFGEEGAGPGQFWLPTAIFIDQRDRIWVTDSYNRRVQVFDYRKAQEGAP